MRASDPTEGSGMGRASLHADLVFHALAFVPAAAGAPAASRAASLFDPRWIAFARGTMEEEAFAPIAEDAGVLSGLLAPVEVAHGIGWLAELFDDVEPMRRCARRGLDELTEGDVASPVALFALRGLPAAAVEILRADLALMARAFEGAHARTLGPHRDRALAAMRARAAQLPGWLARALAPVELSATLGEHGRGFERAIVVGVAGRPGEEVDPDASLIWAIHEVVVQRAAALAREGGASGWARVEAIALTAEEHLLRETPLRAAFEGWSARLDRSGLAPVDGGVRAAASTVLASLTTPPGDET